MGRGEVVVRGTLERELKTAKRRVGRAKVRRLDAVKR
jgi:hypothetical protein